MLGTYNTRSATTNPTGKKRFDAGINGNAIKQSAYKEKDIKLKYIWTFNSQIQKCYHLIWIMY